jgi:transcription termination/antitermination protein NusA
MVQVRSEFALALNQICSERGIDPAIVIESIKQALLAAMRRDYNISEEDILLYEAHIDEETGVMSITKEGKDVTPAGFGRIAAQVAKQVIMQRVREAEKDAIISDYTERMGTLVTGMVLRFDGPNVVVDIGRGQGIMPPGEAIANEFYRLNQRIAVYITEIRDTYKGKAIIVSRSTPKLVEELFAREVPEFSAKAVVVQAIAREAGHRTKIAVVSTQDGVDPVGSCVGQKGIRVQAVINELNGEKIDIIQYDKDPTKFIAGALAPADNLSVKIDEKSHKATVTVPEDQLSLAIGKGGQNARLAARLTGYKIDIKGDGATKVAISTTGDEQFEIDELGLSSKIRNLVLELKITTIKVLAERLTEISSQLLELDTRAVDEINKAILRREKRKAQLADEADKLKRQQAEAAFVAK